MKILLSNFGYGSAGDGKYRNYISHFLQSSKKEDISMKTLEKVIKDHNPDIVCLSEVKKEQVEGSIFEKIPYKVHGTIKYNPNDNLGKYVLGHHRFNAILTKNDYKIENIYLSNGNKKLIYKVYLDKNKFLYFGHFSLRKSIRKKQFRELATIIDSEKINIVCGDFNIFKGEGEFTELCNEAKLELVKSPATFPAHNPKHSVDTFLVSAGVMIQSYTVSEIFSDHLALIGEIEFTKK